MRQATIQRLALSEISTDGPVRHTLTRDQERRVTAIHEVFLEVFVIPLEEALLNFRRDQDPEKEIALWEQMAAICKSNVAGYTTLEARKELFAAILQTGGPPVHGDGKTGLGKRKGRSSAFSTFSVKVRPRGH